MSAQQAPAEPHGSRGSASAARRKAPETGVKAIVKKLRANTGATDMHTVFGDFCAMAAAAIRNRVDSHGFQEREDDYERMKARYTDEQMTRFAEVLALVTLELEENPRDVLGEIYMQLEISSREQGQFFTPYSVCQLMAGMQFGDAADRLQATPFLTLYEPAFMRKSGVSRDSEWVARARTIRSRTLRGPIHRTATLRSRRARQTIVSLRP